MTVVFPVPRPPLARLSVLHSITLARLTSDVSLISLDNPVKESLLLRVHSHGCTDSLLDAPGGPLAQSKVAGNLVRTDRLLGIDHQRQNQKPVAQGNMRPMKDRSHRDREGSFATPALPPANLAVVALMTARRLTFAVWTNGLARPPDLFQIFDGLLVSLEGLEELDDVHYQYIKHHKPQFVKSKSDLFRFFLSHLIG